MTEFDTIKKSSEVESPALLLRLRTLGATALCLFETPRRALAVEEAMASSPQPLHPNISQTIKNTRETIEERDLARPDNLCFTQKMMLSARMAFFTNQIPGNMFPPLEYSDIKGLKDQFTASAERQKYPLSYDQQLATALELTGGDVIQSLSRLCFTSRQYARWHDSVSIQNLPDFTDEEILEEMKQWRSSILACKNADDTQLQDTSGDTYYTWTHALARVMYGTGSTLYDRAGKYLFERGTNIVRFTAQKIKKQLVPSDHRIAARYGNAIGDAILDELTDSIRH